MKAVRFFLPLCLVVFAFNLYAQNPPKQPRARVDTTGTLEFSLPTVRIEEEFASEEDREAYYEKLKNLEKLKKYVEKLYPLAKECSRIINEVNADLEKTQDPDKRKKYMKKLEKELFKKYEKPLKSMSPTQGKILVKLINRECGASAYKLIEEYKSSEAAVFWQLVGKIFTIDLKAEYDRNKEQVLEAIIREIERGENGQFKVTVQ
jgi:hypothetical protein